MTRKSPFIGRSKAGTRGGLATKNKFGREHFVRIGRMGGKARARHRRDDQDNGCRCGKCGNVWCYENPVPPFGDVLTRP
jgi:hypothetical protein